MSSAQRNRDRKFLEYELETKPYQKLLAQLREDIFLPKKLLTWKDVAAFMLGPDRSTAEKDRLILAVLKKHGETSDLRWRSVLLLIFWPGLRSLCRMRKDDSNHYDELWSDIIQVFIEVVDDIDVAKRSHRLVQKILNDTAHNLRVVQERERAHVQAATDPRDLEALAEPVCPCDPAEQTDARPRPALGRLKAYVRAEFITQADYLLLVGTFIEGKTLRDCAAELGLSYQAAKKRRQRAIAAIKPFERKK